MLTLFTKSYVLVHFIMICSNASLGIEKMFTFISTTNDNKTSILTAFLNCNMQTQFDETLKNTLFGSDKE